MPILQLSGNEENFAGPKIDTGRSEQASETADNRETSARCDLAWRMQMPFLDFEQLVINEDFTPWLDEPWRDIVEIDALERLR